MISEKKLIVRVAEGLGNQLFMYAHAYALSKKINYKLLIDSESAYFGKKHIRSYDLDKLCITAINAHQKNKFNNQLLNIKRKVMKKIDFFYIKKRFLIEKKKLFKQTQFCNNNTNNYFKTLYVEGHFETEKYFHNCKKDLMQEFKIKNVQNLFQNKYHQNIKNNKNIVSICIRQNRFSERDGNIDNITSIKNSNKFTQDTIEYIYRAISFFEQKIDKPIFYIWSNDFTNLKEYFPNGKFTFIDNKLDKTINDFFLLCNCKNFIVGPTSFHWWGAWLSNYEDKICIRPKNLNPSNNLDFWPVSWLSI